jgi:hypothetical protein
MDAKKYGTKMIKADDVRDGPIRDVIVSVYEDEELGCLVLELESGDEFRLNKTTTRALGKAYGWDSDGWLKHEIELSLGSYVDFKDGNKEKENVALTPISLRRPSPDNGGTKAETPKRDDFKDSIPF